MNYSQNDKVVVFKVPGTVSTTATSVSNIDTLGFDQVTIDVCNVAATNTSSVDKLTSLTLSHGTTTDVTNQTTISGLQGTTEATATSTQFVLTNAQNTTFGSVTRLFVNMAGKERILQLLVEAPASHSTTCNIATLSRGKPLGNTAALRGASGGNGFG